MLLLGNEAIARGAVESGIAVATTYPGTPASEIGDSIARVAPDIGIYFEYSVNEKVALEVAVGASLAGLRAISSMKHVGVNVASDALLSLPYMGTVGGLVLVSADDPSCHSSQNEQDNRYYSRFASLPMLEPSSSSEAYEMVKFGFELSEKLSVPVLLRETTRVAHTRGLVKVGEVRKNDRQAQFDKKRQFILLPHVARKKHAELLEKMERAEALSEESPFNRIISLGEKSPFGIITSSAGFNYAIEACMELSLGIDILKIGFSHPLPRKLISSFLRGKEKILIVEELDPIMEREIRAFAEREKIEVEIYGKDSGHLSRLYEYNPDILLGAVRSIFLSSTYVPRAEEPEAEELPQRPPVMCPGCPHAVTYYAVKVATKGAAIFPNDIGCYSLGAIAPYKMGDTMLCMGSSVGIAEGLSKVLADPVVAFIGDSTFYHAGLPALANAVHGGHKMMLVVLDNGTTAMTGHQPHPGTNVNAYGEAAPAMQMEKIIESFGVESLRIIDPYDFKNAVRTIKEELDQKRLSVVISRRTCALLEMAEKGKILGKRRAVDQDKCKKCGTCVDGLGCPAIARQENVYEINGVLCVGCGVCEQTCPHGAIGVRK
ncbi:MAG: indolepyruvate ferredoxin oxidoreductase subunit alpha [Thermoplasmata archaeon]